MGEPIGLINGTIFASFTLVGAFLGFMIMYSMGKPKKRRRPRTHSAPTATSRTTRDHKTISMEKHLQRKRASSNTRSSIRNAAKKKNKVVR